MLYSSKESINMLTEIEESGEGLNEWEEKFVDDILTRARRMDDDKPLKLSVKQREIIHRIYESKVM